MPSKAIVKRIESCKFIKNTIVCSGFLNPLFYEDPLPSSPPLYIAYSLFFNFFLTLSPSTSPTAFVALFLWLNVWSCHIQCAILWYNDIMDNDIMDLHLSNLGTLAPKAPCYKFHATRRHVYCRFGTYDMAFASTDLIPYTQIHT